MTNPTRRQKETEIAERRVRVTRLYQSGMRDQYRIAEALGVSTATISRDIRALEAQWREEAARDIAAARGEMISRHHVLRKGLATAARAGDVQAVKATLAIDAEDAKLMGLYAPERREIAGTDGGPLQVVIERVGREVSE